MDNLIKLQYNGRSELKNFMRNYGKDGKGRRSKPYYKARLTNLESYWNEFKKRHQEIILLATKESEKKEEYFKEEIYSVVEDFYIDSYAKTVDDFQRDFPTAETKQLTEEDNNIKIVQSLVHHNEQLSPVQKLQYLKAHLTGEAKNLLGNTLLTSANYEQAWNTLIGRYENKRILVKAQLNVLFTQPTVNQESAKGVKSLLDKTSECLSALQNLGITTRTWDPIIVYFVGQRLPYETLELWEQSLSSKTELPKWDELKQFLEARFRTLEVMNSKRRLPVKETKPVMHLDKSWRRPQAFHVVTSSSCQLCHESHTIRQCAKYLSLDHQAKLDLVKSKGLCVNCLGIGHLAARCPSKLKCYICKKLHHTTLHKEQSSSESQRRDNEQVRSEQARVFVNTAEVPSNAKSFVVNRPSRSQHVLLATALVPIVTLHGQRQICRALIDPGSQASFVTEHIIQTLRLPREFVDLAISGLGNISAEKIRSRTTITLSPSGTETNIIRVEAFIVKNITNVLPNQHISASNWVYLEGLQLADPTFDRPGRIDLLLGADIYPLIIVDGVRKGPLGTPVGQNTIFGWILSGNAASSPSQQSHLRNFHINIDPNESLKRFWELEELPSKPLLTNQESLCEQHFIHNCTRCADGRYQVRLPFDSNEVKLGSSRNMAIVRMIQMEKRFSQDTYLKNEYKSCIKEYLNLKHMELTNKTEFDCMKQDEHGNTYYTCAYLPHHAVLKPSSTSTKVRVVFDASRHISNGKSLNDVLLNEPTIQESLFAILMRWRIYKIAFMADVQKMYRQIRMHPEDAEYQRIVWRDSPDEAFRDYKLTTVTFGTKSAPFIAIRTMHQLAKDECHKYPIGAEAVLNEFTHK